MIQQSGAVPPARMQRNNQDLLCSLSPELAKTISSGTIENLLSDHCTSIDLANLPVTDDDLKILLPFMSFVKELSLANTLITNLSLTASLNLEKLNLRYCQQMSAESLCLGLSKLTKLTALDCTGCQGITTEALKGLQHCQELTVCDFSDCTNLTEEGLAFLPPKILHLSLKGIPNLTEAVFQELNRFSFLTSLDLSQALIPFDNLHLLNSLKLLDTLYLWQCRRLKNQDIAWLQHRLMKRIDLSFCTQLTDDCIPFLQQIEELSLDGCQYLTSQGMSPLICSNHLKKLSLCRCPAISQTIKKQFSSSIILILDCS